MAGTKSTVNKGSAPAGAHPSNGLAIASLVTGIVAFVFGWVFVFGFLIGATAIVLGIIALKKSPQGSSKGMSIAGIITGAAGALWSVVVSIFFFLSLVALGIGGATAGTLISSASTDADNSTQATEKEYAIGDKIAIDDYTLTVNGITHDYQSANQYIHPETGNEYVVVDVTITNEGDSSVSYSTYDFKVQDSAGVQKREAYVSGIEGSLSSGSLAAGGKVSGKLSYEVPLNDTGLKLIFAPSFWDKNSVTVKL